MNLLGRSADDKPAAFLGKPLMGPHHHSEAGRVDELAVLEPDDDPLIVVADAVKCPLKLVGNRQIQLALDVDLPIPWPYVALSDSEAVHACILASRASHDKGFPIQSLPNQSEESLGPG